jgi:hypothetical protein
VIEGDRESRIRAVRRTVDGLAPELASSARDLSS